MTTFEQTKDALQKTINEFNEAEKVGDEEKISRIRKEFVEIRRNFHELLIEDDRLENAEGVAELVERDKKLFERFQREADTFNETHVVIRPKDENIAPKKIQSPSEKIVAENRDCLKPAERPNEDRIQKALDAGLIPEQIIGNTAQTLEDLIRRANPEGIIKANDQLEFINIAINACTNLKLTLTTPAHDIRNLKIHSAIWKLWAQGMFQENDEVIVTVSSIPLEMREHRESFTESRYKMYGRVIGWGNKNADFLTVALEQRDGTPLLNPGNKCQKIITLQHQTPSNIQLRDQSLESSRKQNIDDQVLALLQEKGLIQSEDSDGS